VAEGSAGGTVSSTGLYTAPSTSGTYHLVVTSRTDPTKTATATISVSVPPPPPPPPTANAWPLVGWQSLYVATTGSDSNPGTSGQPFATVARAAKVATAGTIVHVAPGTYTGQVVSSSSGTSSNPITFVSDVKWGAKLSAPGQNWVWSNSGDYIVIQGFEIADAKYYGILSMANHGWFRGNAIHGSTPDCNHGGGGIVFENYSETDNVVDGNVIHDFNSPVDCGLIHGIYFEGPSGGKAINNVIYRTSGWGIHLYHNANKIVIANNTIFNNAHSGILIGASLEGNDVSPGIDSGTVVVNNIVVSNANGCIEENNSGRTYGNTYVDNTCYGNGGSNTIALLTPPSGQPRSTVSGTLTTDPQFVNFQTNGSGDYRLQTTSPAANSGTTTSAPAYDMGLAARPLGAVDRGAYECW
jgi:parallel beta-helix repeat protein